MLAYLGVTSAAGRAEHPGAMICWLCQQRVEMLIAAVIAAGSRDPVFHMWRLFINEHLDTCANAN